MPARSARLLLRFAALIPFGWLAALLGLAWVASRSRPERPDAEMPIPPAGLPPARIVNVPEVGELFVRDTEPDTSPTGGAAGAGVRTDRPVVLLLHGWMVPADPNWYLAYRPLSEIARVLAVDHRGHGRGLRPSQPFRLADAADDVAALLRHIGSPPVVAVGYSMGGPVAQLLWRRHPDLVRGLVLCATSATFNVTARDRLVWRLVGLLQLLLRIVPRHWWERMLTAQAAGGPIRVTRLLSVGTPPEVTQLLPWFVSELDRGSAEDVAEAGRELSRYEARSWIGEVDVPSAVLITADDVLVPLRNQRDMARRIPGAFVQELPLDHDAAVTGSGVFIPALRKAVEHVLAESSAN
jgi:pimeloyl-ACP methyl ester carboxylesterase